MKHTAVYLVLIFSIIMGGRFMAGIWVIQTSPLTCRCLAVQRNGHIWDWMKTRLSHLNRSGLTS